MKGDAARKYHNQTTTTWTPGAAPFAWRALRMIQVNHSMVSRIRAGRQLDSNEIETLKNIFVYAASRLQYQ
jgi:hypothetical protein